MKIEFDAAKDLLKVNLLTDVPVSDTRETEGMVFGYAADRRIVAIEIHGAQGRVTAGAGNAVERRHCVRPGGDGAAGAASPA